MKPIRVLVVDDSFFMRKLISDFLVESGIIEVVDTAKNGIEAVEKHLRLNPDVITMDVEMPQMNGLEALEQIMKKKPVPIIMLSSLTKQGTDITVQALQKGAFDFVAKPSGAISFDIKKVKDELINKIIIAHRQKEKWHKHLNYNDRKETKGETKTVNCLEIETGHIEGIIAIGTSTGGPKALQEVITKIPKNFPYGILIVQHMPAGFTKSLATRLNSLSEIEVLEAEDQQLIKAGTAYIAPGNYHMTVRQLQKQFKIELNQNDPVSGHRPSVDVLFQSLATIRTKKIFVIMTGMGNDGTKGLTIAKQGEQVITIGEDETTCVVYGMPKSAIQKGLIDMVIPLHHITNKILESVQKQRRWQSWI
ncbi:chemotaxis response regulator protein-glutamate methylesterase [Tepidibacillus infernus]|uniref:Protein-glutamate methylesterase/protein-glutamine glutaminase n=1 Tax=Tepidibacillus decaturensis TaxID=1413211 RepID=A0A135L340_9BACI|nr:chemotaxis response regulator protein-glutamate methylesterase [Tepidibacillus decaturensis]KXG43405.1 hypothetical protein U473_04785 [Tepidibacillus decaturensis]